MSQVEIANLTEAEKEVKFRDYMQKHPREVRRLQKNLVIGAYEGLLASGVLDPKGKSDTEILYVTSDE